MALVNWASNEIGNEKTFDPNEQSTIETGQLLTSIETQQP